VLQAKVNIRKEKAKVKNPENLENPANLENPENPENPEVRLAHPLLPTRDARAFPEEDINGRSGLLQRA
jgi:hypothetical protein